MNTTEARKVAPFVGVTSTDKDGKAKTLVVPGHNGKQYEVIIRRNGLSTECRQSLSGLGYQDCLGNSKSICYHSLAAIIKAAELQGQSVAFCHNYQAANNLSNTGGVVVKLKSWQSGKVVWLVVTGNLPEQKQSSKKVAWQEFVEIMQQEAYNAEVARDESDYNNYRY